MDIAAKLTSKGQITVPKQVRDKLSLQPGDRVLFRLEDNRAVLARTEDFLDLAGSVPVPAGKRGADWKEVRKQARSALTRKGA
jgi:AbrB family looped-hinge helix DNA binding protein